MSSPRERIKEIEDRLEQLPKGTLTYKNINGKKQPYIQRSIDGKSVSYYVKVNEREQILLEFQERSQLLAERQHLIAYQQSLYRILEKNPYLDAKVGCGYQDFRDFACGRQFYVDKTHFITQWVKREAKVTLITRPRRFGKTMLLSTVDTYFNPRHAGHPEYFSQLKVWQDKECRKLYGTIPVISVSFGSCKGKDYRQAIWGMLNNLYNMYEAHRYLLQSEKLDDRDKAEYQFMRDSLFRGEAERAATAIQRLSQLVYRHYQIMPLILIDEYDTPLLEAYADGYWEEMIGTCRQLFQASLKENPYYSRAIITGVTKVTKNSLFSDMNNIEVATVTCDIYSDCFGFTQAEVTDALQCQNIDRFDEVKAMYDGFIFGKQRDIYNPWSVCNYLRNQELLSYWTNTSSNKMIGEIIRRHPVRSKGEIEQLMAGNVVHKEINENITFQYLDGEENSLWSLLLAVGYIKADNVVKRGEITECDVSVTNQEVMEMFRYEILAMFENGNAIYPDFVKALLAHRIEELEDILLDISYTSMSYFDVGRRPSERAPENFYHGLVLGLIVSLRNRYRIVSNRESGRGRYDIAMYPLQENADAFIMEFKVYDAKKENSLSQTADNALYQIEEKGYERDLLAAGIPRERIYRLGFAFEGKDVLIKESTPGKEADRWNSRSGVEMSDKKSARKS